MRGNESPVVCGASFGEWVGVTDLASVPLKSDPFFFPSHSHTTCPLQRDCYLWLQVQVRANELSEKHNASPLGTKRYTKKRNTSYVHLLLCFPTSSWPERVTNEGKPGLHIGMSEAWVPSPSGGVELHLTWTSTLDTWQGITSITCTALLCFQPRSVKTYLL